MKSSLQSRSTFLNNRATRAHLHADTLPIGAASKAKLTVCRLYYRRHRALAAPDERVGPEGVDLVALELGLLQIKGGDDDPAGGMHL